jgi:hypothetical protein
MVGQLRRRYVVDKNSGLRREGLRTTDGKASAKERLARDSGDRNREIGATSQIRENFDALDTGGGGGGAAGFKNGPQTDPGVVPGKSKWEISGSTAAC